MMRWTNCGKDGVGMRLLTLFGDWPGGSRAWRVCQRGS
jgi:hypothetical protein